MIIVPRHNGETYFKRLSKNIVKLINEGDKVNKFEMENGICEKCVIAKGIKFFKCIKCGKDSGNYVNGVSICYDCCKGANICRICGKEFY